MQWNIVEVTKEDNSRRVFLGKHFLIDNPNIPNRIDFTSDVNSALRLKEITEGLENQVEGKLKSTDWKFKQFIQLPSKGYYIFEDEKQLMLNASAFLENKDDDFPIWEQVVIRELKPSEAYDYALEVDKLNPTLYFWDDDITDGLCHPFYGYNEELKEFITRNLVGSYYHQKHCGIFRVTNSGYRIPVVVRHELKWLTVTQYCELKKSGEYTDQEIQFTSVETDLDINVFKKAVEERMKNET